MSEKKFRLYLVRPEDIPAREQFYLITPKYCLLYTQNAPPKKNREIVEIGRLPALASEWLKTTIDQIRERYLTDNEREILRRGKEFAERFREELEKERNGLEGRSTD